MAKVLGFIGGFLAFVGIVASLFIEYIAWFNNGSIWVNAIGGGSGEIIPNPIVILEFLPGVIAIIGAILCFIPKKVTLSIGGLLVIIGAGLFVYGLYTSFGDFSFFWTSLSVHIGYGWMATVLGGLLGFIGTFVGKD
ncbi:MAG: hypothetical protein ACTSWX_03390 [Promethearchaeota archaeon]